MIEHGATRETDALIAERVFGLSIDRTDPDNLHLAGQTTADGYYRRLVPGYTLYIEHAWQVWVRMLERVGHCEIIGDMEEYGRAPGDIVTVSMWSRDGNSEVVVTGLAPLAICQCALAALEDRA